LAERFEIFLLETDVSAIKILVSKLLCIFDSLSVNYQQFRMLHKLSLHFFFSTRANECVVNVSSLNCQHHKKRMALKLYIVKSSKHFVINLLYRNLLFIYSLRFYCFHLRDGFLKFISGPAYDNSRSEYFSLCMRKKTFFSWRGVLQLFILETEECNSLRNYFLKFERGLLDPIARWRHKLGHVWFMPQFVCYTLCPLYLLA
jgi:hypothetical protein